MSRMRCRLGVACCVCLLVAGQRADAPGTAVAPGTSVAPAAAKAVTAQATHGPMAATAKPSRNARATSRGKPTAPIGIGYALAGEPVVGRPLSLVLRLESGVDLTDVRITFAASDGLVLGVPGSVVRWPSLAANEAVEVAVVVTPVTLDVHYVTVGVEGTGRGALQARTLMVPVRMRPVKALAAVALKRDQGGQSIRALPAVETSR